MKCLINCKTPRHILPQFKKYFEVVTIDVNNFDDQYSPKDYFVFIDNRENQKTITLWRDNGFKVVVEKFWEQLLDDPHGVYIEDGCLYLYTKNMPWFDLALENKHRQYHHLRSNIQADKFFLMLMNLRKQHRDRLFDATQSYHADSLYSYVERGVLIQDDVPATGSGRCAGTSDQRFYNPDWYARTNFSIVAETSVNEKRFISEKIFKPLAFQHPFVVYGTPNTLTHLHELGFETFAHVIDESYDTINNSLLRLQAIEQVLKDLYNDYKHGLLLFSDLVSQQKILHNHNKFYNVDLLFKKEIINPIKEFINT